MWHPLLPKNVVAQQLFSQKCSSSFYWDNRCDPNISVLRYMELCIAVYWWKKTSSAHESVKKETAYRLCLCCWGRRAACVVYVCYVGRRYLVGYVLFGRTKEGLVWKMVLAERRQLPPYVAVCELQCQNGPGEGRNVLVNKENQVPFSVRGGGRQWSNRQGASYFHSYTSNH